MGDGGGGSVWRRLWPSVGAADWILCVVPVCCRRYVPEPAEEEGGDGTGRTELTGGGQTQPVSSPLRHCESVYDLMVILALGTR